MERWHTLYTKPRREHLVAQRLVARDIDVFLPMIEYTGKTGKQLDKPFFPRYIFARFDWMSSGASRVQWTPGLRRVLMFDGAPAVVPEEWIDDLQNRLSSLDGDEFLALKPGEPVRVSDGPFRDMDAIFEKYMNSRDRVAVLMDIVGRQTRVELSRAEVERIA